MTTASVIAQPPPTTCSLVDLACQASRTAGSILDYYLQRLADTAADLVVTASTWWLDTDSVNPGDSAVLAAQGVTHYVVIVMLLGSMLVQAIRLMITRKGEPLVAIATGLVRYAVASGLGITLMQASLRAGDELSSVLLDNAASSFAQLMKSVLTTTDAEDTALTVAIVSILTIALSIIQWVLMALRQAGLLVVAAMIPLAASGSLNRATRSWLDRIASWALAMIVYKPAAALIYFIGFRYLSGRSIDANSAISTSLSGLMVLLLAVVAMPATLRFFAWSGVQISGGSGSGSGFLGAAGAIAMTDGHQRAAITRAHATETTGPGSQHLRGGPSPSGAAPTAQSTSPAAAAAGGPAGAAVAGATAARAATRAAVQRMGSEMTGDSDGRS